jgi:hypothetical protein
MNAIRWIAWLFLLFWDITAPCDIPGKRNRDDISYILQNGLPQEKSLPSMTKKS